MTNHHDLLIEILTEELPPKRLSVLQQAFAAAIEKQLKETQFDFSHITAFATPRRLAIIVYRLAQTQAAQKIERKGPQVAQAYDAEGRLTPAGRGFLRACGITENQLCRKKKDNSEFLYYIAEKPGLSVNILIPEIVQAALAALPIAKPMRWGNHDFSFVRPVHGIILLYGEQVIKTTLFGLQTDRVTVGHRQLCHEEIVIGFPENYEVDLEEKGFVVACAKKRKEIILDQIQTIIRDKFADQARACIDEDLLEEVAALVEWPKVLLCRFDEKFLSVPAEALIASMQGHQKCFAVVNHQQQLLPYFITVSNLRSKNEAAVIHGNERVMRARLSDAQFFYDNDVKIPLASYAPRLSTVIYQQKLGSLADKVARISELATYFAQNLAMNEASVVRAAQLCKLDLLSHMVGEFPELQGIMGKYYALQQGESTEIAAAIEQHYWPRFATDQIPTAPVSVALALADRLDSLLSFFSIGLAPSGSKDPFALRRAASGFLKIILENKLPISIQEVLTIDKNLIGPLEDFFKERLKSILLEQGIALDVFKAVSKNLLLLRLNIAHQRMQILQQFKTHPAAAILVQAHKRVNNFLGKDFAVTASINPALFVAPIEQTLCTAMTQATTDISNFNQAADYFNALLCLAALAPMIDQFFKKVLVMVDDIPLRQNRLGLLHHLRLLFSQLADFSVLELEPA